MKDDFIDDLIVYDLAFGADDTKCPYCGESFSCSLIDDEVTCPKCGKEFRKG